MQYAPPESPELDQARLEVQRRPHSAGGYIHLSGAFREQRWVHEAELAAREAVRLDPREAFAYIALGDALREGGSIDEAIVALRKAVELSPNNPDVYSRLLLALPYVPGDPVALRIEHERWASRHANHLKPRTPPSRRRAGSILRVGFLSAAFCNHPISQFVGPLLNALPCEGLEVHCYSGVRKPDNVTAWLQTLAVKWVDVAAMNDDAAAEQIRRDEIDVLIDLDGHSGSGRLMVFARQPAPVQMTWLGSMGTTGMSTVQWRLTDAHADPPGMTETHYTEKLLRLPRTVACFGPSADAPPVVPMPALSRGYVTFGSFGMLGKITPRDWRLWAAAQRAVPNSRVRLLRMGLHETAIQQRMRSAFAEAGGDPDRLELFPGTGIIQYLQAHGDVDLLLDTTPFTGHTTTCNALWMGVPTMTFVGTGPASRSGVSVAAAAMLGGLVATSEQQYVALVKHFVSNLQQVNEIRLNLRAHLAATPLLNAKQFLADFHATLRQVSSLG